MSLDVDAEDEAADQADGDDGTVEQKGDERRGDHAGDDEAMDRVDAEDLEGIDLLADGSAHRCPRKWPWNRRRQPPARLPTGPSWVTAPSAAPAPEMSAAPNFGLSRMFKREDDQHRQGDGDGDGRQECDPHQEPALEDELSPSGTGGGTTPCPLVRTSSDEATNEFDQAWSGAGRARSRGDPDSGRSTDVMCSRSLARPSAHWTSRPLRRNANICRTPPPCPSFVVCEPQSPYQPVVVRRTTGLYLIPMATARCTASAVNRRKHPLLAGSSSQVSPSAALAETVGGGRTFA